MAYTDNNTPVIEKIHLPSGNEYYIADRQIRDVVDALSQTVAGGVSYVVAWDGESAPTVGNIPAGVTVVYNDTEYTGTLVANNATPGAFYLVKSSTQIDGKDVYDEYVPVGAAGSKSWQKIGDTQIALTNIVTDVSLSKQTDTVIGSEATFTITQPTVSLSTGATAGDGVINVATDVSSTTKYLSASASGANTAWNSKDQVTALTGVKVTAQPTVTLTANAATDTGRVTYVESASASKTNVKATASGANTAWNSKDSVTALTGLGTASTSKAIGQNATFAITQPTIALATNNSTATGRAQVATGSGTSSSTNTDWLKGVSVSNGTLTIGAATHDTTYLGATASGANTAWSDQKLVDAVTDYASPTTDTVIGTDATFTVTQPTVALSTGATAGTGVISLATDVSPTTKYLSAAASGTAVGADGTDTVIGSDATFTITQPTVTLTENAASATGRIEYVKSASATNTNIKATASGANTAWNSKDQVTVLTNSTDISVTKGGS